MLTVPVYVARVYNCWNDEAVHLAFQNAAIIQLSNNHLRDLFQFWVGEGKIQCLGLQFEVRGGFGT